MASLPDFGHSAATTMFCRPYLASLGLVCATLACQGELATNDAATSASNACMPLETDEADPVELVFAEAWRPLDGPTKDPLASHRPVDIVCPSAGWGEEFGVLEVRTAQCNYLSVEQSLAAPIALGDTLRLQLWWQNLIALEPATGHLALSIDGELVWALEVAIPGPSEAHEFEFPSPVSAPAGASVNFHLHNHGQNTWTLAEFARVESADPACD